MTLSSDTTSWKDLSDLRVSLIGNKDLKYKLVGNVQFVTGLVGSFNSSIDQIIASGNLSSLIGGSGTPANSSNDSEFFFSSAGSGASEGFLDELEKRGVILKILCSYITEVNTNEHENITKCLEALENLIDPIVRFLQYFIQKFIPLSLRNQGSDTPANWTQIQAKIHNILAYSLDIFLNLSNIKHHTFDTNKVARFITCLLILGDDESVIPNATALLIRSMKLIPLLLSSCDVNSSYILVLLTSLLKRLSKVCNTIISTHFPSAPNSDNLIHQIAFEDPSLPNIELNSNIIRTRTNTGLLLELIVSVCQIFHAMKENDYEITRGTSPKSNYSDSKISRESSPVVLEESIYLSLLLLLKYDDELLSLASLNLICVYLGNLKPSNHLSQNLIFQNYKKLCPRIIQMLKLQDESGTHARSQLLRNTSLPIYLLSPGRILADLCSKYPVLNDEIKDANTDFKIVQEVESLIKSSQLLKILKILKKNSKNGTIVVDFTVLLGSSSSDNSDDEKLADLFYLLSVYTSSNEVYRNRVVYLPRDSSKINLDFGQIIFEIVDNLHFLLNQNELGYFLLQAKKVQSSALPWFSKNLGIIRSLLDGPIYTNCLYLIRSLSRSVTTLRTFYVECNAMKSFITSDGSRDNCGGLITNFLQILKAFSLSDHINEFFNSLNGKNQVRAVVKSKKIQMINKSITISLLANFILDFSSFRFNVDSFLQSLSELYRNSLSVEGSKADEEKSTQLEDEYQKNFVQLNIMQVIKNFVYQETLENKRELLDFFPLQTLIEKTYYGFQINNSSQSSNFGIRKGLKEIHQLKVKQKLVAFDILRNLTAGAPQFNYFVARTYQSHASNPDFDLPSRWYEYVVATILHVDLFTSKRGSFEDDEVLLDLILNDDYVRLVTSINYFENHKYTKIDKIKKEDFPHDSVLKIWLRFMELSIPSEFESKLDINDKVSLNTNLNELKSSVVWILLNLTRHNTYDVTLERDSILFETVGEPSFRRLQSNQRIMVDSEEEDEEEDDEDEDNEEPEDPQYSDELSVHDRARYLQEFGFGAALIKLIKAYSKQPRRGSGSRARGRRPSNEAHKGLEEEVKDENSEFRVIKKFDIQNSHDLLERLKSANQQITGLLKGNRRSSGGHNVVTRAEPEEIETDDVNRATARFRTGAQTEETPTLTGSVTIHAVGPDLNRGGEGFGYGSDDDMQDDADDNIEEDDDAPNLAGEDEEDPREYWVG